MRSLHVHMPHIDARATDVLRSPLLSRSCPYESDGGLIPSAKDTKMIGPNERTSSRRKDRTKKPPNVGTGRNNEIPASERLIHALVATAERTSRWHRNTKETRTDRTDTSKIRDKNDQTETRVTKQPNQNGHDTTEILRTRKTNKDCRHSCRHSVQYALIRNRSTKSKRRTLRMEAELETKTKKTNTKHDQEPNGV